MTEKMKRHEQEFETMIFGDARSETYQTYETLEEAKAGHEKACQHVRK